MTPSPTRSARQFGVASAALVLILALTACASPGVLPTDTSSPDAGPAESSAPSTDPEPVVPASDSALEMEANIAAAVAGGNTSAIETYLVDPTRVVIAASEADAPYSAVDAVLALDYVQPGVGVWDFTLDEATLAGYRASEYYGDFFVDDAIVGRSDARAVVVFVPRRDRIDTIFMSIDEALILS